MHRMRTWIKLLMKKKRMSNRVVKVKRETIATCMRCPICDKILRDATTISECLHTFCRKCIYEKLSDEELEACPVCDVDLGCVPLEKLRPDHNLQDVRAKIFPFKRRKVKAPEAVPSKPEAVPSKPEAVPSKTPEDVASKTPEAVPSKTPEAVPSKTPEAVPSMTIPVRRKERSLSSLVVSTPRVSTQATMTGKRTKARKVSILRGSSFTIEKSLKKEEAFVEDRLETSNSPDTEIKFTQNVRQNSPAAEPSSRSAPNEDITNGNTEREGKVDLCNALNYLVEVANGTKSYKCNSQGFTVKSEHMHVSENEVLLRKNQVKGHVHKSNIWDEMNINASHPRESLKPKKLRRIRRKKEEFFGESNISSQAILDAACANRQKRIGPVWFSLVASEDQSGESPLPQISANYLRIKDGNAPVSSLQKYLMMRLNLTSETEVEIKCMGQPIIPTLQLHNLVDLWLQTASTPQRVQSFVGASAKEFVMVLDYARKILEPQ